MHRYAKTLVRETKDVVRTFPSWVRAASRVMYDVTAVNATLTLEQREAGVRKCLRACTSDEQVVELADAVFEYYHALDAVILRFEHLTATAQPNHGLRVFFDTWLSDLNDHEEVANHAVVAAAYWFHYNDIVPLTVEDTAAGLMIGYGVPFSKKDEGAWRVIQVRLEGA